MGDVSDLYRRALKSLHRDASNIMGQGAQDRKELHNNVRRNKRETEAFFRRNIDENMSPLITPSATPHEEKIVQKRETKLEAKADPSKRKENQDTDVVSNKRLEMLYKWKVEKEKTKAAEKAKSKPLFKVCHVHHDVTPNLDSIYKTIKGKPFGNTTLKPSKFAPVNHDFKPPTNLKAVPLKPGPKVDILSYVKTLKFDAPAKVNKSSPKKGKTELAKSKTILKRAASTRALLDKARNEFSKNAKPTIKNKPENKPESKTATAVAGSSRTTRATAKATQSIKTVVASKTVKKSPTKLSEKLSKLKIVSPKQTIRNNRAPVIESDIQVVDSSSHSDDVIMIEDSPDVKIKSVRVMSQDNTVSTTVDDHSPKSGSKGKKSPKTASKARKSVSVMRTPKSSSKGRTFDDEHSPQSGPNSVSIGRNDGGDHSPKNVSKGGKEVKDLHSSKRASRGRNDANDDHSLESFTKGRKKSAENKTPKKSVQTTDTKERKTPKKNVGFNVNSIPSNSITPKLVQTPKNTTKFRKTPLRSNIKDLESNSSSLDNQSYRSASDDYPIEFSESDKSLGSDCVFSTPKEKVGGEPEVYISPFVTISRGKQSARKEYVVRKSLGKQQNSPEEESQYVSFVNKNTSPKAGAAYFTRKLNDEIDKIKSKCADWQGYLDGTEVPDEAKDSIHVTIGQSRLLIAKKFQQFRGLIEECQSQIYSEKPITCEDLHGFWDMIYMQVENLEKRFSELQTRKENGWKEILFEKTKPKANKKGRGRPKKPQTSSKLKELIAAARQKKTTVQLNVPDGEKLFAGGYFEVRSPVNVKSCTPNQRRSVNKRLSVLAGKDQTSRCSSSPGLLMMKVSQAIKQGGGLTPARSILKTDNAKSTGKKSVLFSQQLVSTKDCKVVLFSNSDNEEEAPKSKFVDKESPENKENVLFNLISLSPGTPLRRSTRLTRSQK